MQAIIIHFSLSKEQPGSSTSGTRVEKVCVAGHVLIWGDISQKLNIRGQEDMG
jgi:hypothetical protein